MSRQNTYVTSLVTFLAGTTIPFVRGDESQKALTDTEERIHEKPLYPSRDAMINILLDPKYPCVRDRGVLVSEVDIPMNTCASANFTFDNNVHIEYPGLCPGGVKFPYISIYPSADCTGEHAHPDWYDRKFATVGPGHCLSKSVWGDQVSEAPENQWSIMFSCDDETSTDIASSSPMELSLPQPPPVIEKPKGPRPTSASVSDSACYIPGLDLDGSPKFIFQHPEPDTCVDVAAQHMLKIYRNAMCANGGDAVFVRYSAKGCKGTLVDWTLVDDDILATNGPESCIEMGGQRESSYMFMCNGNLMPGDPAGSVIMVDGELQIQYSFGEMNYQKATESSAAKDKVSLLVIISAMMLYVGFM